ncbi:uncharacterized protein FMAN_11704 [Fusarium mangiferae]|uniref:Uncharacterized protein n=1 Tax=Fusarium mangiferae TaxID=192010 RepID=A0A1L7TG93_FUSMA|nr:uncharacterized protein FMAN_11704 [Fusarium mangiferae]CVK97710.1 uncharacterized protein FMAN_11704 [Fusarium mangiferae]
MASNTRASFERTRSAASLNDGAFHVFSIFAIETVTNSTVRTLVNKTTLVLAVCRVTDIPDRWPPRNPPQTRLLTTLLELEGRQSQNFQNVVQRLFGDKVTKRRMFDPLSTDATPRPR